MLENMRKWLVTLLGVAIFASCVFALTECNKAYQQSRNGKAEAKVESVLVIRYDTLRTIDTLLKKKIIYRDTGRIEYIHDDLDKITPPIGDENVCIAENQLRQCVKCQDSLEAFKLKSSIDSQTIDTLTKIAKNKEASPTLIDDAKKVGVGVLIGIAIKSLF